MSERQPRRAAGTFAAAALASLAGAAAVAGHPPIGLWPATVAALAAFFVLADVARARARRPATAAAFAAWAFGLGYFGVGVSWIGEAFVVRGGDFVALRPFAILALAAGLALFFAVPAAIWAAIERRREAGAWRRAATFAALLAAAEFGRGYLFTGFPWNLFGAALTDTWAAQGAALVGVYGLTLAVLAAGFGAGALALRRGRGEIGLAAAGAAALALAFAFGWSRAPAEAAGSGLTVRIVQPDIRQTDKWDPNLREAHMRRLAELTAGPSDRPLAAVVWPEAAPPSLLDGTTTRLPQLEGVVPRGAALLAGWSVVRAPEGGEGFAYANSLVVFDDSGRRLDIYDKSHLVPFGEYVPFPGLFEAVGLGPVASRIGGFTAGPGIRTVAVPGLPPFGPLICYEAIFPGRVVDPAARPAWLVQITDDSWYGVSIGPYQHLAAAQMRAIEEGLPVMRAAMSGVSAAIDPYGRIVASAPLLTSAALDVSLPAPLPATAFSRWGHFGFWAGTLALALAGAAGGRIRRKAPH